MNLSKRTRSVLQAAWVVPSIPVAAKSWAETTGIGPFFLAPDLKIDTITYRGEKASLHFSVAIAQGGGVQIELIEQHCDSPSAYRDLVGKGERGFHHIAFYCDDYDADYRAYKERGFVPAIDGTFGDMRFSYFDTSAAIGCMVELIEHNPIQAAFFERIRKGAENWDGISDPLRPGFP